MLAHKGFNGRTLLALAALIGVKDTFEAVLTTIGTRLDTQKVRCRCVVCGARHFTFDVPPSFIAWSIAVLIFPNLIHLMVDPFFGAMLLTMAIRVDGIIIRPTFGCVHFHPPYNFGTSIFSTRESGIRYSLYIKQSTM